MTYYFIISLPLLIYFTQLLLTNAIIPHFKKKSIYKQMKERSEWPRVEKTKNTLRSLYRGDRAKITSILYRNLLWIRSKEFIYGEIHFLSFFTILEKAGPQPQDIFYDLGSGTGKAVFSAALFFNLSKSCGIELLPPLNKKANNQLKKAFKIDSGKNYLKQLASIEFIHDNFLTYDFREATIIYVAATCLSDSNWELLIDKMSHLKSGSRIIVVTKSIKHERFETIYQGIELMSWGLAPVKIYKIR